MKKLLAFLYLGCFFMTQSFSQPYKGYSLVNTKAQKGIESDFQAIPTPSKFSQHLAELTKAPHVSGSVANEEVIAYMAKVMEAAGLKVDVYPYDIYMPTGPGEIAIELVTPIRLPLNNQEYILEEDPFSSHASIDPGWNAYSGSGEVTAEIVYANYGRKEDFEQLKEMGISVEGKIVLARYGGNFRGYKAKFAEAAGAIGLVIYTDPMDSGYMRGLGYPEGPYYNESTIQRGSVLTLDYTGDPLTPFQAALPREDHPEIERLDPEEVAFHTIPVTPIPYGSAKEIISRMTGTPVPRAWQGGLPYTYRIEGGEALTLRLKVEQGKDYVRASNVVGTLEGSEYPDEWILLGCHFDAWSFGASDPNSGTAMLLQVAEALGELAREGKTPKRTIKIAHWDAEEFGILGSTEWVEQFRDELDQKAIAYMNADAACSGLRFYASSSPSLKQLILDVTQSVSYPIGEQTVYEHWQGNSRDKEPGIGNLGGGSDHLGFYAHVGIPSLGCGMGGPTLYHSAYDDFYWYKKHADSAFVSGPTTAKIFGTMALRLANADILPLDAPRYAQDLKGHLGNALEKINAYEPEFDMKKLNQSVEKLQLNAEKLSILIEKELASSSNKDFEEVNQILLQMERAFIDKEGMEYGSWFRSLYASSDPFSGYASWMLPGLLYEAAIQRSDKLSTWEKRYLNAFERLNGKVLEALAELE